MVELVVMEKKRDGSWTGLGTHQFRVTPRKGEYVEKNDDAGIGQIYEVIAVLHPLEGASTAGDLIIRHVGDSTDFRKSL